jgi:hypothetical protein
MDANSMSVSPRSGISIALSPFIFINRTCSSSVADRLPGVRATGTLLVAATLGKRPVLLISR